MEDHGMDAQEGGAAWTGGSAVRTDGGAEDASSDVVEPGDADAAEDENDTADNSGTDDSDTDDSDAADSTDGGDSVVLLDVLPNGRPDDGGSYRGSPVAYALGTASFGLYELSLAEDADVSVSDRIRIDGSAVSRYREVSFDDLTRNAAAEIEYAVEAIVDEEAERFVDFYNEAGPITLRLHQLNLLPGIGKKLRNNVLDERKRGPFESFEEVADRVSGLHRPREVIVDRINEEIREADLKYRTFVGREA